MTTRRSPPTSVSTVSRGRAQQSVVNRPGLAPDPALHGYVVCSALETDLDARDFLKALPKDALVYVDPPYITQGDQLYLDKLSYDDHKELAGCLAGSELWLLTYDCDDRIPSELYPAPRCAQFNIKHTAQVQHVGSEYAIFSDNLHVPNLRIIPRDTATWVLNRR